MSLKESLTAVADAIRSKTNTTEEMTIDQMPALIGSIEGGSGGGLGDITYNGNYVTTAATIAEKQFQIGAGLDGITTVILPNVENIGLAAFYGAAKIETIDIGANVQTIHFSAFNSCSKLSKLIFRGLWLAEEKALVLLQTPIKHGTGYIYVPDEYLSQYKAATNWSAFASQIKPISELESGGGSVEVDSITNDITTVNGAIFGGNIKVVTSDGSEIEVKKAKLPNVTAIYSGVFGNGSNIEVLDVGSSSTNMTLSGYAFAYNSNLKTLIFRGWIEPCGGGSSVELDGTPILEGNGYIYVPDDLLDRYKTESGWSGLASQIKQISELP